MRTFSAALIALLGSCVLLGTQAKAAVPFIEIPADGWDPGPEVRKQYEVGIYDWARRVKVNPVALASSQIQVDLFDAVLTLEQTEPGPRKPEMDALYFPSEDGRGYHRTYSASQTLWVGEVVGAGRVSNDPVHPVRISNIGEGRLMASFNRGHLRYELRGNLLVRSDQRRLPPEAPSVRDPYPLDQRVLDTLASPDTPSTVRVAFGYGNNATAAGGYQNSFRLMENAVMMANAGFAASGIRVELQRAGNALTGYTESSVPQTLDDLATGPGGPLGITHRMRDNEKADLLVMIVSTQSAPSHCGQALRVLATKQTAFAVVEQNCLGEQVNSLAHEIGHLLGADHDPDHASVTPPKFAHGHGYQAPSNAPDRWRTVMAAECSDLACARINQWSSPHISHNGLPTGTPALHDNARVLNHTRATIADFYPDPD